MIAEVQIPMPMSCRSVITGLEFVMGHARNCLASWAFSGSTGTAVDEKSST